MRTNTAVTVVDAYLSECVLLYLQLPLVLLGAAENKQA